MTELRKFVLRVVVLVIPFIVILGVPCFILFKNAELLSFKQITAIHNEDSLAIIGPAFSNPDKYMKLNTVLNRKPKIIALGTSRVMQLRNFFFRDSRSFYNAGGGIDKIKQFDFFLKRIPQQSQPAVIFIGLDQYFFNEKFDNLSASDFDPEYKESFSPLAYMFDNCFFIWQQVLSGKINLLQPIGKDLVGLNASVKHNGFLYDGSYYYGERIQYPETSNDYEFKDTFDRIQQGVRRFEYAKTVNQKAVHVLDVFLSDCATRGIVVYGFLPPYANSVIGKMNEMGDKYGYLKMLYSTISPIFAKYGFAFFDFTVMDGTGLTDKNFIDGFHGSNKVYLRMMINMCRKDTSLGKYVDKDYLQTIYTKSKNDLELLQ